nr:YlxR family protein [Actinotalea subterranea]
MGCRARGHRSTLLRVVVADEGDHVAVVDRMRTRPGRGAWLHDDLKCLELAERRRAFTRALRTEALDTSRLRGEVERGGAAGSRS